MNWKKIAGWLHLWLGLAAGIVVFIVSVTGAIYTWQPEISGYTEPYRHVKPENKPYLPVTELRSIAEKSMNGKKAFRIIYEEKDKAPAVQFYQKEPYFYFNVYVNQYTGEVQKVLDRKDEFFRFILDGHMYLWLPQKIGHEVVAYGTLIFVLMLITGIILWWPRTKGRRKSSFKVKWGASPKRINYDLHNVFGFYVSWIILFAALTGLVWSFQWMAQAEFFVFGGGTARPNITKLKSDIHAAVKDSNGINHAFTWITTIYPEAAGYSISFPANDSAVITARAYPSSTQYYNGDYHYFDQHTGKEIKVAYMGKYANASTAEKAVRMNYDIHVGSIAGLPGRLLMFFAALTAASLPVTGFLVWWGRKKKKKKPQPNKIVRQATLKTSSPY